MSPRGSGNAGVSNFRRPESNTEARPEWPGFLIFSVFPLFAQPIRIRFHRLDVIEDDLDGAGDWNGEHQSDRSPDSSPEKQRERDRQRIDFQAASQQLGIENIQREQMQAD